jgi:hypothetical protein
MGGYSRAAQTMNFAWQIARKIDRLDMGDYSTRGRLDKLVVIFGMVRAINPVEEDKDEKSRKADEGDKFRSIAGIIEILAARRKRLRTPESRLKISDSDLSEGNEIEDELDGFWDDLSEVIYRCKITDNVRPPEESAP